MPLNLSPETERLIEEKTKAGGFSTPDDAILAAFASLEDADPLGDCAPGELEALMAEGVKSLRRDGPISHEEVLATLRVQLDEIRRPR